MKPVIRNSFAVYGDAARQRVWDPLPPPRRRPIPSLRSPAPLLLTTSRPAITIEHFPMEPDQTTLKRPSAHTCLSHSPQPRTACSDGTGSDQPFARRPAASTGPVGGMPAPLELSTRPPLKQSRAYGKLSSVPYTRGALCHVGTPTCASAAQRHVLYSIKMSRAQAEATADLRLQTRTAKEEAMVVARDGSSTEAGLQARIT
jgi:hypothetical protein